MGQAFGQLCNSKDIKLENEKKNEIKTPPTNAPAQQQQQQSPINNQVRKTSICRKDSGLYIQRQHSGMQIQDNQIFEQIEQINIPKRQELLDNEDAINMDAEVQQQINQELEEEKLGENQISLKLNVIPKFKYVDSSINEKQILPMMIKVTSEMKDQQKEGSKQAVQRIPIDLICIIDVSGSMSGEKLQLVKESLKYLLTILTENDRICLIQFGTNADILTPFKRCNSENKDELNKVIQSINTTGSTNIQSGFESAIFMMKNRKYVNKVTGLFLLSDGQDDNQNVAERVQNLIKTSEINCNFKLNTFGYGNDHDAKEMTQIASQQQGNYYFIENLKKVDQYFVLSLSGLLSIVAEDIEIELFLEKNDIDVDKTYGGQDIWKYNQITNKYKIYENLLLGGVEKHYIFELQLPILSKYKEMLSLPLLKTILKYKTVKTKQQKQIEEQCEIKIVSEENGPNDIEQQEYENKEVSIEHFRVLTAEKIGQAKQLAQQQQHDKAQELLDQMILALQFSKFSKDKIIEVLISDCNRLKEVCKPQIFEDYGEAFMLKKEQEHKFERALSCHMNYANEMQEQLMDDLQNFKQQ